MKTIKLLVILALVHTPLLGRADVLAGPITNSANGHFYYLLAQTNWVAAEQQSKSIGGHLATIDDAAEQLWVHSTFSAWGGIYRALLIGLNDRSVEDSFRWTSGEPVAYSNWNTGEPNDGNFPASGVHENAVIMNAPNQTAPGKWNDVVESDISNGSGPDFAPFNGIVEIGPVTLAGPITNTANGHIYYLLAPDTWESSEAAAVRLGGHLATINDQAEQDWVFSTFNAFAGIERSLWLGLREVVTEGNYQWVSGEPLAYTNWGLGEPNNNFGACGGESYVQMVKTNNGQAATPGTWNDIASPTTCFPFYDPVSGVVEIATQVQIQVSQVAISWNSFSDINYQVQYVSSLTSNVWTNLGVPVIGTGSSSTVFDSTFDQPRKFYRVISVP